MITNWYENCINITKTLHLNEDKKQVNSKYTQEIHLIKFLMGQGYTTEQIREIWNHIDNGTASSFDYDTEEGNVFFEKQMRAAKKIGDIEDIHYGCELYQEEIQWINGLEAPLWVRKYLFGMFILYKSMKKKYKYVEYRTKWCSYVLSMCGDDLKYKRKSETISKWNRDCGLPMKLYPYDNKVYFNFKDIKCKKDNLITDDISLDNFTEFFNLLDKETFICPECGQKFEKSGHSKVDICPDCVKKHIREHDRLRKGLKK